MDLTGMNEVAEIYEAPHNKQKINALRNEKDLIQRQYDVLLQKNKALEERMEDLQFRNKLLNSHVTSLRDLLKIYVLNDCPGK